MPFSVVFATSNTCDSIAGTGKWKVSAKIQQLLNTLKVGI